LAAGPPYFYGVLLTPSIGAATAADVPALAALINRAYRGAASLQGWTTEDHLLDGPRIGEAALRDLLTAPQATLLTYPDAGGTLIGCVYVQQQGRQLYLGTLAVAPEAQAQGVGRQLLAAADTYARQHGCATIKITVLSARPELLAWYERHGYVRTGVAEPFPATTAFGRPRQPLTLLELVKPVA
jgi:ribosomal protein S18 acetylase RimI-like enzyme